MEKAGIERILVQLDGFLIYALDRAQSNCAVSQMAQIAYFDFDNGLGLSEVVINEIDHQLALRNSDTQEKLQLLNELNVALNKYFQFGDQISDTFITNLRIYYRHSIKYNYHGFIVETKDLAKNFSNHLQKSDFKKQLSAEQHFEKAGFLFRKHKLPLTTNVNDAAALKILKELDKKGLFKEFLDYVPRDDWKNSAPEYLLPYLNKILDWDIGKVKSAILWDILGYVLLAIEDIQNANLSFKELFHNEEDYSVILVLFKIHDLISRDGLNIGFLKEGSVDKRSKASLIAIAEALTSCGVMREKYSTSEQVRAIARSFNIALSPAAEFKRSKFHGRWVDHIQTLIRPNLP